MKYEDILEAKAFIEKKINQIPQIAIILGSGLSPLAEQIKIL